MLVLSSHRRVSPSSPSSILLFFRPSWYIRKKESFRHCVVYLGVVVGAFACTKVVCWESKRRPRARKAATVEARLQDAGNGSIFIHRSQKNFQMQQRPSCRRAPEQAWGSRLAAPAACALSPARTARCTGTCAARTGGHHTCENGRHVVVAVAIFGGRGGLSSSGCPWQVLSTSPDTGALSCCLGCLLGDGKGPLETSRPPDPHSPGVSPVRQQEGPQCGARCARRHVTRLIASDPARVCGGF